MQPAERSTSTASIRLLWPFLALADRHKKHVSRMVARLGLTEAELKDPDTRVPHQLLCDMLNEAIERSGLRDLGLIAAQYVDSSHLGISEYIARSRPTLREALQGVVRYLPLLADAAHIAISVEGKIARRRFWLDPSIVVHEAAHEFANAIAVLTARRTSGIARLAPLEVCFTHAKPADTTRHEALFCCPIRFGADATEIVFPSQALDRRMVAVEPVLDALLTRQAVHMLAQLPQVVGTLAHMAADLARQGDLRTLTAERLARKLGCSVRTMHRRLRDEGTTYRELLDRVRSTIAMRRLEQSDQTIAEIAYALGFASPQSFHRSFKRWTGVTAMEHRRSASGTTHERSG